MTALELIENYSFAIDTSSVIFCIILSFIIRFVLYFSNDKKFKYVKRAIFFVFIGSLANILFAVICNNGGNVFLMYLFKNINHFSFMSCLYLFILYVDKLLGLKHKYAKGVAHLTRSIFCICLFLELCSGLTGIGLCYTDMGWKNTFFNFYNAFYVYGVLLLVFILVFYDHRLIKSVRISLISTEVIVGLIMLNGALHHTSTFTSLTYVLPIIVVLIILHSNPIDSRTGAMSYKSFISYVEKYIKLHIPMDFMILRLQTEKDSGVTEELGKVLTTFWYDYYSEASFFFLENDCYVLAIPRTKANGDTLSIMEKLFYEVFPHYYEIYNLNYKAIGLPDMDFIHSGSDINQMTNYLLRTMKENSMLIIDDEKKSQLKLMQHVKEHLADIDSKQNYDDERVLVYCQPIRNTETGEYDTAEALMRMSIPEQSVISPVFVIPLAENLGYIHSLTKIMLNKVCKELISLEAEGYKYKRVSVNISASELKEPDFCKELVDIIKSNDIDPAKIGIELTESQNENDFNLAKEIISGLKEEGMTIYLDDFGTGYSNFERIVKLGFDVLKFDRSILLSAEEDKNIADMLKGFASSFKQLNYQILFEGIESETHVDICSECGANYLQGFKYSKPVPMQELRNFFSKN